MPWAFMPRLAAVTLLVLANLHNTVSAADERATPVSKVIELLTGLVKEVQDEGKREAATYEKFSCFCKTSSESKSAEITKGADKIDDLSTSIEAKTTEREEKQKKIAERKNKQESMSSELDSEKSRCMLEKNSYEKKSAELTKAQSGINDALKSLANAKKGGAASLLELDSSVRERLALADALKLAPGRQVEKSFLQQAVDPQDAEYKFHSGGIVNVLTMVQKEYKERKEEVDSEWEKTDAACTATKDTLTGDLKNNKDAISKLNEKAEGLSKDIAKAKEDLVSEQTGLQDAQAYLKDLTLRCEGRAKDWDQRTATRSDEVEALTKALGILKGTVKGADEASNKRALLLSARKPMVTKVHQPSVEAKPTHGHLVAKTALTSTEVTSSNADSTEIATELTALQDSDTDDEAKHDLPGSAEDVTAWLHGGAASFVQVQAVSAEAMEVQRHEKVLDLLQKEGRRLQSSALSSLVMRAASDPFGKVKSLIQDLLERLLKESAGEATKKGFCDEQLAKLGQERDYNMEDARKLNAELRVLEANRESLDTEAGELKDKVGDMSDEFAEAKQIRDDEKKDNLLTLEKAKEGLEAVTGAYDLLKEFYNSASFLQASPVDEDAPDVASGDYKGKQGAAKGILGLLQVIISDFQRTLKKTEADEKKGAADFEQMKQDSEADVAGHTTKVQLNNDDSKTTSETIKKKKKDMKFAMDVVDSSLKGLEDLKPTCQDSGRMSYADRVAKREEEIAALTKALCTLDPEGVEADCQKR
jgi:hypothetical protein